MKKAEQLLNLCDSLSEGTYKGYTISVRKSVSGRYYGEISKGGKNWQTKGHDSESEAEPAAKAMIDRGLNT